MKSQGSTRYSKTALRKNSSPKAEKPTEPMRKVGNEEQNWLLASEPSRKSR